MTHCQTCSCRDLGEAFAPRRPQEARRGERRVTAEGAAMTPLSETEAAVVARFEAAPPAPESWGGGLRSALRLIDANGCETFTGSSRCLDPNSGRTRGARYGADAWCPPCIAADALAADDRTGQR